MSASTVVRIAFGQYIKSTDATTIVCDWASNVEFYKFRRCVWSNSEALAVGRLNINVQIPLLYTCIVMRIPLRPVRRAHEGLTKVESWLLAEVAMSSAFVPTALGEAVPVSARDGALLGAELPMEVL